MDDFEAFLIAKIKLAQENRKKEISELFYFGSEQAYEVALKEYRRFKNEAAQGGGGEGEGGV